MKKIIFLILLLSLFVGCSLNRGEKISVEGMDLVTDEIVNEQMLTSEKNVVCLWQPTCPPCEVELKIIERAYKDYPNINFVGIGVGESKEVINSAIENWNISFNNYYITEEFLKEARELTNKTPTIFYLDKDGYEVAERDIGYVLSTEALEEGIAEFKTNVEKAFN